MRASRGIGGVCTGRHMQLPRQGPRMVHTSSAYAPAPCCTLPHPPLPPSLCHPAGVKLWDVSQGEETARPVAEWQHYSKFEAEAEVTQVAMLKVS